LSNFALARRGAGELAATRFGKEALRKRNQVREVDFPLQI